LFLPPGICTKCDVLVEGKDYVIREATILGEDISEIVTFESGSKVSFHQFRSPRESVIVNEIKPDPDGSLSL
jgi:hypothetical protein